jgi:hypothetical protein
MRYALAANSYGPVDTRARDSMWKAVLLAERRGFHMVADLSVRNDHLVKGRNNVHRKVILDKKKDYEGVLWVDADIVMPHDAIFNLLSHRKPFITGVYFKRGDEHEPLIGEFYEQDTPQGLEWWSRFRRAFGPGNGLVELNRGTCGFGFVYTSVETLEALLPVEAKHAHDPGPFSKLPFIGEPGDDFSFCFRIMKAKERVEDTIYSIEEDGGDPGTLHEDLKALSLWIDTDLVLGHLMEEKPVGFEDFVASALQNGRLT